MLYTTDLVTVNIPETSKIMLTLNDETSDYVDLTEEAVLIIDYYVRSTQDFMSKLHTLETTTSIEEPPHEEKKSNTDLLHTLESSQQGNSQDDKILCAEIILPENAVVTIANIKLTHQKAGEILSLSVSDLLEKQSQALMNAQ